PGFPDAVLKHGLRQVFLFRQRLADLPRDDVPLGVPDQLAGEDHGLLPVAVPRRGLHLLPTCPRHPFGHLSVLGVEVADDGLLLDAGHGTPPRYGVRATRIAYQPAVSVATSVATKRGGSWPIKDRSCPLSAGR